MSHKTSIYAIFSSSLLGLLLLTASKQESRQFSTLKGPMPEKPQSSTAKPRSMKQFQSRRAYPGAPPVIPHPAEDESSENSQNCLSCHRTGAYVSSFERFAPTCPHPEYASCRQCHVAVISTQKFRSTDWQKIPYPSINQEKILGGPPPIPHHLRERENCVACHGSNSSIEAIRTSHPERVHCQQCHVATKVKSTFKGKSEK